MHRWTFWRVLAIGAAYVALYLGVSAALFFRWQARHASQDGSWKFFWIIPTNYARNYVAWLILPPLVLFLAWLVARSLSASRQAAV